MYDIVIIGAGVVGGLIARSLAKYDLKICILEKENDVSMGASKANSGIVHSGYDPVPGTLKAKFNIKGSEMMEQVTTDLGVKYKKNGTLVVAYSNEDMMKLKGLYIQGKKNDVKELKLIDGIETRLLEPNLSSAIIGALYAPSSAVICPHQLTIAAIGNAMDNGVDLKLNFNVSSINKHGETYTIEPLTGSVVETKCIINAAGIYSDKIAKMVGDTSFEITPRYGEYILLDTECSGLINSTIFRAPTKMGKGVLATKTVDGNILLGPTAVNGFDKEKKETTQEGINLILKSAEDLFESIPRDKIITSFAGIRAKSDTGDFIINCPYPNFINVAGIDSPGLTSAPAIAEYIEEMIKNYFKELKFNKSYNPLRSMSFPSGKIVCRCENVSEGEIIDAIRQNPGAKDTDGIKRRTRSGMGRCQGGFCLPQVIEILSSELNIPYESVTKFGGKSVINFEKTRRIK